LRALGKRAMSPISEAIVSASSSATPGMVISSRARSSARASGRSSRSSGASWRSRSSITLNRTVSESRQTSGTPCSASSSTAPGWRSAETLRRRPHCVSRPKVRFIEEVRSRIRCERRRSRSRIARSSIGGTQTVGTRSRRARSASTRASTRSVLQASGAIALTLRASAI
jgi:hypothetical protein